MNCNIVSTTSTTNLFNSQCVQSTTNDNYCLTNVRFVQKSPNQYLGNHVMCSGCGLSPLPRF